MTEQICPCCSWTVRVPSHAPEQLAACPICGQCLEMPASWSGSAIGNADVTPLISPEKAMWKSSAAAHQPPLVPRELTCPLLRSPGKTLRFTHGLILFSSAFLVTICAAIALALALGLTDAFPPLSVFEIAFMCAAAPLVGMYGLWYAFHRTARAQLVTLPAPVPTEASELGAPLAVYSNRRLRLIPLVLALLCIGSGIIMTASAANKGLRATDAGTIVVLFVGGAFYAQQHRRRPALYWVLLLTQGKIVFRNQAAEVWRWDQMSRVWVIGPYPDAQTREPYVLRFTKVDGAEFTYAAGGLLDVHAQHGLCLRFVPELAERLRNGETLDFGPLRLSSQGVAKEQELLTWDALADVRVRLGKLTIRKKGNRQRPLWKVRLGTLPNAAVLLNLLPHVWDPALSRH